MIARKTSDPRQRAFQELYHLGFYFAMRSCENLLVSGKPRRTRPLELQDFRFFLRNRLLPLNDPHLTEADAVSIIFRFQKKAERDDIVTQCKSGNKSWCPVRAAGRIIRRLLGAGARYDTKIFMYFDESSSKLKPVKAGWARSHLREFISSIDHNGYGLHPSLIGLHSLRSSSAMQMYLNGIPTSLIMLMGRWSSDAVLRYIRKQVKELSHDVSAKMINRSSWYTVPDANMQLDDPRAHTPASDVAQMGMGKLGSVVSRAALHLWE